MSDLKFLTRDALYSLTKIELEKEFATLLSQLPSRAPIYLPTERISLIDKILGVQRVLKIYKNDYKRVYKPKLHELKNKFKDKNRCFLIGNGPSLNVTDLDVLEGEITFAVNGFFLKMPELNWKPTFYVVEDHLVAEDRVTWINAMKGVTKLFPAYLGYIFEPDEETIFFNHRPRKSYPNGFDFSLAADEVTYTGCTVTFTLMQLAAYLGFKEIYLIGVDASYDIPKDVKDDHEYGVGVLDMPSDDPNHFNPNYFGKGFRWHDPQVSKMLEAYSEAKRALEKTGQRILNATIGGKLEVFDRVDFEKIFPQARSPLEIRQPRSGGGVDRIPRTLVIDITAINDGSATGNLKGSLFADWPPGRLLQLSKRPKMSFTTTISTETGFVSTPRTLVEALSLCDGFEPELIVYRPVPDSAELHRVATDLINRRARTRLVTWIMDDWPSQVSNPTATTDKSMLVDLELLLGKAVVNLAIGVEMAEEFTRRYRTSFAVFANGVNPIEWAAPKHHEPGGPVIIRYSGGLAENMTLTTVLKVARLVDKLAAEGFDIKFEVSTQQWWYKRHRNLFSRFLATRIESALRSPAEYRDWLATADVLLIPCNFDEASKTYLRYSIANKLPECMISGAAVFGVGPAGVATIGRLKKYAEEGAAVVVDNDNSEEMYAALRSLVSDPGFRNRLSNASRRIALRNFNIFEIRDAFTKALVDACRPSQSPQTDVMRGVDSQISRLIARAGRAADYRTLIISATSHVILNGRNFMTGITLDRGMRDAVTSALLALKPTKDSELVTSFEKWVRRRNSLRQSSINGRGFL